MPKVKVKKRTMKLAMDQLKEDDILLQKRERMAANEKPEQPKSLEETREHWNDSSSEDDDFEDDGNELNYLATDQYAELDVSEADEQTLHSFMSDKPMERRTLADIIMAKMKQREAEQPGEGQSGDQSTDLNPQVVEVYTSVGKLLSRYRSGKIPKAFKIIPALRNWEEVLYLTEPESWSPQAMYAGTRLFASNLNPKMAQRYYNLVLLPAIREDLKRNRVLNYHYYRSLSKAIYKPAAFFKGILLPLCESGCSLREATIVGSVLSKVSIPMLHSAAAMLKIAQMPYSGPASLFLRVLLDKRYNLPYKVIDALLFHFLAFKNEQRRLPVLWHQSLLVFAQRYKAALTMEQKDSLKPLLRVHHHAMITPEIRRELYSQ